MTLTRIVLMLLTTILLSACTRAGFWAVNAPAAFAGYKSEQNIAYGDHPLQKLDVYVPSTKSETPRDVIVFFYGGKWQMGSRSDYKFVANNFTKRGYVVVIPDYRLYPEVRYPAFAEDGASAIAWVHENIAKYGGNPDRIHVSGHSAGAHIGAMVVSDESFLKKHGLNADTDIKSFAGLAGPYDFTPEEPDLIDMFGPPEKYPQMQATTFISGKEAPMLLLWGADDTVVGFINIERIEKRIHEKSGRVKHTVYPGMGHVDIAASLSWLGRGPVADDMDAFFKSVP